MNFRGAMKNPQHKSLSYNFTVQYTRNGGNKLVEYGEKRFIRQRREAARMIGIITVFTIGAIVGAITICCCVAAGRADKAAGNINSKFQ